MLIREKVRQAVELLNEYKLDCWITFVRESGIMRDPMMDFLCDSDMTWHSAFLIFATGETQAIVGQLEKNTVDEMGVYQKVTGYVEGIGNHLQQALLEHDPKSIAVNFSENSEVCDGLTHGMYRILRGHLAEIGFADRLLSSEKLVSSLRARKTPTEIGRMKQAVAHTLDIFAEVSAFIEPGQTEEEIAEFMRQRVRERGLVVGWDPAHCPAVFTGPDNKGPHYHPTDLVVERGHVLNMDFGVKVEDYVSDMQRTFYLLEEGETKAPADVRKGFDTIVESIEMARQVLKPGVLPVEVDKVARDYIVSRGYDEFPHGLGHQVGRFVHDGNALLGPAWEKYADKVYQPVEEGMVFTIEPRLRVPGRGDATTEEMVVVRAGGAEFLGKPQTELILVG
ncbi:MAG: Xaa-Pro peptidase family protein [Xanthomonadales bacterium]|jgi:Xaa-Pro aminopeptidase|nr:Xaa-Pro peptidase family protein [Xanthomonadales bacterium]